VIWFDVSMPHIPTDNLIFSETVPAYIRLPKSGNADPHTGLSRSALDLLIRPQPGNDFRPPVKSKMLKMTGDKRGIVLIDFRSLRIYLDGLPAGSRAKRGVRKQTPEVV
jgi:hypothetical protein